MCVNVRCVVSGNEQGAARMAKRSLRAKFRFQNLIGTAEWQRFVSNIDAAWAFIMRDKVATVGDQFGFGDGHIVS